jgi:hypothetical protein
MCENISFEIQEDHVQDKSQEDHVQDKSQELLDFSFFEQVDLDIQEKVAKKLNYQLNFSLKDILRICDYYEIAKKQRKGKKEFLVEQLVEFEENPLHWEKVQKRQHLWYCIEELKKDSFMKKCILW